MAVKSYNFASPCLNEVDQSKNPEQAATVGPIAIGRAQRGPAEWSSYSCLLLMNYSNIGEPVAGGDSSGDVWRSGEFPAGLPYGPYAAQAWLANNPTVTFVRLLGVQSETATDSGVNNAGYAGWSSGGTATNTSAKGAYGLYVFPYPMPGTTASLTDAVVYSSNSTDNKIRFMTNVPASIGGLGSDITLAIR